MCKVNAVWAGVVALVPKARFLYWYELGEELEFYDPDLDLVRSARFVIQDDGSKEVEIRV